MRIVKIGFVPSDGGVPSLNKAVGMSKAVEIALTGEALACVLVAMFVAYKALKEEACKLAFWIAPDLRGVLRLTGPLLRDGQLGSPDTLLERSNAYQAILHATSERIGTPQAFVEERAPKLAGV